MDKQKIIKGVKIAVTCLIVFLFLWFLFIYPLGTFNLNEKSILNAAKRYYELNPSKLPREGEISTVGLSKLYGDNYLKALYIPYTKKMCSVDDAWAKVKKEKGEYKYYAYLKCGVLSSNVDHNGPNIILNGKDEIKIDLGGEYKELGVKSVTDNTDGKMDVEKVQINSSAVDTSKVGTYNVKYLISDSFQNQTVKIRKVVVRKTLVSIINKDTKKTGVYRGEVDNNYIRFANNLYRIARLNSDGSIMIVSNDSLAFVNYDSLDEWLNKYYYSLIPSSSKKFLTDSFWCNDIVENASNYQKCSDKENKKVSTLSISDYKDSIANDQSYLYSLSSVWLSEKADDKKAYLVFDNKFDKRDKTDNLAIKPVLTLKKGIDVTRGDGSKDDPYAVGDVKKGKAKDKLNTRLTGEYITYGGNLYRIIESEEEGSTKVIGDFALADLYGSSVIVTSDDGNYIYNPNNRNNFGYKIAREMFDYFKTDYFVSHEVEVPIYDKRIAYGKEIQTKKYKVKVTVPNIYEIYSSSYASRNWVLNSVKDKNYQNFVDDFGRFTSGVFEDDDKNGVRVVAYFDPKCSIVSGSGTLANPYKIAK